MLNIIVTDSQKVQIRVDDSAIVLIDSIYKVVYDNTTFWFYLSEKDYFSAKEGDVYINGEVLTGENYIEIINNTIF